MYHQLPLFGTILSTILDGNRDYNVKINSVSNPVSKKLILIVKKTMIFSMIRFDQVYVYLFTRALEISMESASHN